MRRRTVKGVLADVNCEGHLAVLLRLFGHGSRIEFWSHLSLITPTFADLGLAPETPDVLVWQRCQQEQLLLLTGNRNAEGNDSLEAAIRTLGTAASLPVFTLANPRRFMRDRDYAERTADKFLQDLFDIERYRGTGRVYIP
jgi:hypothetical protein